MMNSDTLPSVYSITAVQYEPALSKFRESTMFPTHWPPLPADSSLIFLMMLFLRDLRALPEQTEDSSTRDRSAESRSLMIMHIIRQKSRQLSTLQRIIHIKKSGVYSSRILIPVPRLSFLNLPKLFPWQTMLSLLTSMQPEKRITSGFPPLISRN